jgi:hypothetical protein
MNRWGYERRQRQDDKERRRINSKTKQERREIERFDTIHAPDEKYTVI